MILLDGPQANAVVVALITAIALTTCRIEIVNFIVGEF